MKEYRKGTLFYNQALGRYDIRFGLEEYYDGLHCGECFEVQVGQEWIPVRIEVNGRGESYLVGLPGIALDGLAVRI